MRSLLLLLADGGVATVSLAIALDLRFDGIPAEVRQGPLGGWLLLLAVLRMATAAAFGTQRWSFRFSGLADALRVGGSGVGGTLAFCTMVAGAGSPLPPRGALVTELLLALTAMLALRFGPRLAWTHRAEHERRRNGAQRAIIAGAGAAGELLLRDLARSRDHSYRVIGFVDDDVHKLGTVVAGCPVLGPLAALPEVVERHRAELVLIAIPHLPAARLRELLSQCASLQVRFKILPLSQALANPARETPLESLALEDLLPRTQVRFSTTERARRVAGRTVLVTGAAGSIGSELARQLLEAGARRVVLLDQDENGLYLLQRALVERFPEREVIAEVANVRDPQRLAEVFRHRQPQDVLHAAAHKQVPLLEDVPCEAVKTNVVGTRNVVQAAAAAGAERMVLISTDKAVRPKSVMGATKRVAEMVVLRAGSSTPCACVVRFGNVLGSAGSVVPLFRRQIDERRPVTVTHPEVERYFMTVSEAVGLVLEASYGDHGAVCTLEMGEPIRVLELARHMVSMAGLIPDRDIPIVFTGLRPGEKMTEDLLEMGEEVRRLDHGVMATNGPELPVDFEFQLQRLMETAAAGNHGEVRTLLAVLVPGFQSFDEDVAPAASLAGIEATPARP